MFKVVCVKEGKSYIPRTDLRDIEYLIFRQTFEMAEKGKDYGCNGARIDVVFDYSDGSRKISHRFYNCTIEFMEEFDRQLGKPEEFHEEMTEIPVFEPEPAMALEA